MKIKKWKDMNKKERAKLILTILQGIAILILCGVMIWGIVNTFTNKGEASAEEIAADISANGSRRNLSAKLRGKAARPIAETISGEYEIMPMSTSAKIFTQGRTGFQSPLEVNEDQYHLALDENGMWAWEMTKDVFLEAGTLTINDIIPVGANPEDYVWYQLGSGFVINGNTGRFINEESIAEASGRVARILIVYSPYSVPDPPTPLPTYYNVVFQTTGLAEGNPSFIGDLPRMQVEAGTTITIPVMKVEGYSVSVNIFEAATGSGQSWPITSFPKQYEVKTNVTITYNFDAQEAKTTYEQGYSDGYETGTGQGYNSGYDNGYTEGQSAGYQNGYNAGLSATNTFTWDWLINFTNGLFSANLFGQISLGTVVMAMIAIAVLGGLLKLFFGG